MVFQDLRGFVQMASLELEQKRGRCEASCGIHLDRRRRLQQRLHRRGTARLRELQRVRLQGGDLAPGGSAVQHALGHEPCLQQRR